MSEKINLDDLITNLIMILIFTNKRIIPVIVFIINIILFFDTFENFCRLTQERGREKKKIK